tara:strand:- start:1067 stop:1432 length:366 start_codon:yes stop_codon:yes gene_type:complete
MKDYKQWIYHETKQPKIINNSEFEEYEASDWADSPAQFLKLESVGLDKDLIDKKDPDETAKAQQALEAVEGVVQSLNNQLNIDVMNKNQLEAYIVEHYSIDLDKRKTLKQLRKQAKQISGA